MKPKESGFDPLYCFECALLKNPIMGKTVAQCLLVFNSRLTKVSL